MFEWFPRRATQAEVTVAEAILSSAADPRARLLSEQFRAARRVERSVDAATLRVVVPWTTEDLRVDLDEDVISDPVHVHNVVTGQTMQFRVQLARGGFFRCLEGRSAIVWPRRWDVDSDELATAAAGALSLPDRVSSDAFTDWVGIDVPPGRGLTVRPPATTAAIEDLQGRESLELPTEVRELLQVTDGLFIAGWAILGVRDLVVVEIDAQPHWQVAVGVGSRDDRRCLIGPDGGPVIAPAHDAPVDAFESAGTDFRSWLAGLASESMASPGS